RGGRRALRAGEPVRAAVGLRELWNVRVRRRVVHALYHPVEVDAGHSPAARPRGERSPVGGGGPARVPPPHLSARGPVPPVHYHRAHVAPAHRRGIPREGTGDGARRAPGGDPVLIGRARGRARTSPPRV